MKIYSFLFLYYLIIYASSIEYENITLENQSISLPYKRKVYYHIITESNENLPNYVKIIVRVDTSPLNYDYRHTISYYKDSTFSKINQFTEKSFSPIMWLTKEQIKNGFYLSIECEFEPIDYFSYYMNISLNDNIELIIKEQYNFYLTEDNYLMNLFLIANLSSYSSENNIQNNSITIWVKGNKNISTKLNNISKYEKHSIYDAYILELDELKEYNFSITIEGTIGDFINIGSSFFQNFNHDNKIESEGEIYGFLKKGIIEENCFEITGNLPYLKIFDDINTNIKMKAIGSDNKCISIPSGVNELFYLIHNVKTHYLSNYFSLSTGIIYEDYLELSESFGYIPMKIEDNFNFITFHIHQLSGTVKAYIKNCEDYPFCTIEKEITDENIYSQEYLSIITFSFQKMNYIVIILLLIKAEKF